MTAWPGRFFALCCVLVLAACGAKEPAPPPAGSTSAVGADLTPFQLEHGIGPITTPVTLGPLDSKMAHEGKELFTAKCSACHKMTERYVGPALGDVTIRRTPAFVMNQILNPEGMYSKHPVVRQLLGEYMTQMPNLGLTVDQAREVVEYLRTEAHGTTGS